LFSHADCIARDEAKKFLLTILANDPVGKTEIRRSRESRIAERTL
jgi:hypothetical protein